MRFGINTLLLPRARTTVTYFTNIIYFNLFQLSALGRYKNVACRKCIRICKDGRLSLTVTTLPS
jgi:hypothetical protein